MAAWIHVQDGLALLKLPTELQSRAARLLTWKWKDSYGHTAGLARQQQVFGIAQGQDAHQVTY